MQEKLAAVVRQFHESSINGEQWETALAAVAGIFGDQACSLERFEPSTGKHRFFRAAGIPSANQMAYLEEYARISPRIPLCFQLKDRKLAYDYMIMDEAELARDPFYSEFLPRLNLRYFVAGILRNRRDDFAVVAVQRTVSAGHIDGQGIRQMQTLVPHLTQAFDFSTRIEQLRAQCQSLASALGQMDRAIALVGWRGEVTFINAAMEQMLSRETAIRLSNNELRFADADAAANYGRALSLVTAIKAADDVDEVPADFLCRRGASRLPLLISVRPLFAESETIGIGCEPIAIVFVSDPAEKAEQIHAFDLLFGFTEAEAALAQALVGGVSARQYALEQGISPNTAYTHLRRIKEKVGASRQVELIRKLNAARLPSRS